MLRRTPSAVYRNSEAQALVEHTWLQSSIVKKWKNWTLCGKDWRVSGAGGTSGDAGLASAAQKTRPGQCPSALRRRRPRADDGQTALGGGQLSGGAGAGAGAAAGAEWRRRALAMQLHSTSSRRGSRAPRAAPPRARRCSRRRRRGGAAAGARQQAAAPTAARAAPRRATWPARRATRRGGAARATGARRARRTAGEARRRLPPAASRARGGRRRLGRAHDNLGALRALAQENAELEDVGAPRAQADGRQDDAAAARGAAADGGRARRDGQTLDDAKHAPPCRAENQRLRTAVAAGKPGTWGV